MNDHRSGKSIDWKHPVIISRFIIIIIVYSTIITTVILFSNVSFIPLLLLLILCFTALGIITSDYLLLNLQTISHSILNINDKIAGLTLLALGNAMPDIVSTYKSINNGFVSLAIGELLGAIFFAITILLGLMVTVQGIKLDFAHNTTTNDQETVTHNIEHHIEHTTDNSNKNNNLISYSKPDFLKDLLLFSGFILCSLYFMVDGHLKFVECLIMFFSYTLFVIYSVWTCDKTAGCILNGNVINRDESIIHDMLTYAEEQEADEQQQNLDPQSPLLPTVRQPHHLLSPLPTENTANNTSHDILESFRQPNSYSSLLTNSPIHNYFSHNISSEDINNNNNINNTNHVQSPTISEERISFVKKQLQQIIRENYNPGYLRMSYADIMEIWEHGDLFSGDNNKKEPLVPIDEEASHIDFHKNQMSSTSGDNFIPEQLSSNARIDTTDDHHDGDIEDALIFTSQRNRSSSTDADDDDNHTKSSKPGCIDNLFQPPPMQNKKKDVPEIRISTLPTNKIQSYQQVPKGRLDEEEREQDGNIGDPLTPCFSATSSLPHSLFKLDGKKIFPDSVSSFLHIFLNVDRKIDLKSFIILLFSMPIVILGSIIIPTYDHERIWMKKIYIAQIGGSPLLLGLLLLDWHDDTNANFVFFGLLALGCLLLILVLYYITVIKFPQIYDKCITNVSILGFVICLCIISNVVQLIIKIFTKWSTKIPESVLGLTLFAWGNSTGDLISNLAFMKIGVVDVAIGSCFGSPLLYFLFGISFDGLLIFWNNYSHPRGEKQSIWDMCIDFNVDSRLLYTVYGIITSFVILLLFIPLNGWKLDYKIGILLISVYIIVTLINIYTIIY
ncbi:uncharacterized protein SCODWIG_02302 [Saccharomycodes ludwigii]|uniref:Sodium/calcium exchanger membrane region domain-containing protein n=1 Tax=Saccharomycodes ludwigii TaxID=36035 RepID=A0A376B7D8_9ASCO|nr:hypothetical protein SCDLUD_001927 [Saccharomycodes ludwigii]KAH3902114.1 hypothetical protein SCDLUD_001927 [Saccharomycodes ludwigii]SSD60541.1 uncharacterized protein SCODWIG_02302 [Saccharomycodes ludwigii]